ncbi:hypothetical protein HN51_059242 [Arachis hypogaea]|uniref:Ribosomal RNA-processing protein 17 n=1 Tax=Arachis hypogaea TaxID=3818 RepID=A0A444X4N5_ARAHY|nr:ribosomal RNA-processing protein 17 [Arachis ipaensis]XP_020968891.1 ribosomal RNA-processing protein 17 [Arachis ipaensis]XP_025682691.1 ribosomal RNA-processing protein 17 [Arachis hypogaea]QHN82629.1 ribosomal RNA-processing protein [Arachis hypogaea]RYQ84630.1 hypothetical protein Ahy_B10g104080 [Arachis hypogaea]
MVVGEEPVPQPASKVRHLKKRALKNKSLSVSFNEKDLKDYVTGFHKRKKKRRKEAQKQQEEVLRRKRSEERKKRKLEREFVLYGCAPTNADAEPDETDEHQEDIDQVEPIAEMKTYESGDLTVTVVTSEINPKEESYLSERKEAAGSHPIFSEGKHKLPINNKKAFKKVAKHRPRSKPKSKRNKNKGKKQGKK